MHALLLLYMPVELHCPVKGMDTIWHLLGMYISCTVYLHIIIIHEQYNTCIHTHHVSHCIIVIVIACGIEYNMVCI